MTLYCCGCEKEVGARLTDGSEIYPYRTDLHKLPFWKCDACGNYVGCHHKTNDRTRPLGCIPTREIRAVRKHIHEILDPIWKCNRMKRTDLYKKISDKLGYKYHTSGIRSLEEARKVEQIIGEIK